MAGKERADIEKLRFHPDSDDFVNHGGSNTGWLQICRLGFSLMAPS